MLGDQWIWSEAKTTSKHWFCFLKGKKKVIFSNTWGVYKGLKVFVVTVFFPIHFLRRRRWLQYMPFEWWTQKGLYWPPWSSWFSRNPWPAWEKRRTWWSRSTWYSWLRWSKSKMLVSLMHSFVHLLQIKTSYSPWEEKWWKVQFIFFYATSIVFRLLQNTKS